MISEAARKNHEELFPNHKSTLKVTDPELIEVFDNFAFDEVLAHSKLDTKIRAILILASIIGSHAVSEFKIMVAAALNVGVTPIEVKEILYQSVPYVGMARAFDFVHATNDVLAAREIQLPLESQSTTDPKTRYDIKIRELITLSILIALGGVESQIKGHMRGNLNLGHGRDMLLDVITQLLPWVGYPKTLNALSCLNEVSPEVIPE